MPSEKALTCTNCGEEFQVKVVSVRGTECDDALECGVLGNHDAGQPRAVLCNWCWESDHGVCWKCELLAWERSRDGLELPSEEFEHRISKKQPPPPARTKEEQESDDADDDEWWKHGKQPPTGEQL